MEIHVTFVKSSRFDATENLNKFIPLDPYIICEIFFQYSLDRDMTQVFYLTVFYDSKEKMKNT